MPKKRKNMDPLNVRVGLFERPKRDFPNLKRKYSDPLNVTHTFNPLKALRRWRKRRDEKKAK